MENRFYVLHFSTDDLNTIDIMYYYHYYCFLFRIAHHAPTEFGEFGDISYKFIRFSADPTFNILHVTYLIQCMSYSIAYREGCEHTARNLSDISAECCLYSLFCRAS